MNLYPKRGEVFSDSFSFLCFYGPGFKLMFPVPNLSFDYHLSHLYMWRIKGLSFLL